METSKVLATEAKEIAEQKIVTGDDVLGAMKLALEARRLYPRLEGIDQLILVLDILVEAADSKDYSGNKDYYKILRVDRNAEYDVIKKQYRKIALNVHPDKNPSAGAEEAFKMVLEAFEVLSDNRKRQMYDQGVWRGLSEISKMDAESISSKMKEFREEWEKRKMQMSKEDAEELQRGINRKREAWKIRRTQMSNEHFESLRRRIQQAEEGWKKRRTQMSEDDIENSHRKMREEWQKKRSQRSDEDIQRLERKRKNDREEWEKKRSQMSQEDIESSRRRREKAKEEFVKRRMEQKMAKEAEEEEKRKLQPKIKFEE